MVQVPETLEYGVSSLMFRSRMPFHPGRLHALVHGGADFQAVIRSKGVAWLATRPAYMAVWGHAGKHFALTQGQSWYACVAFDQWEVQEPAALQKLLADMQPRWGDRRQELVIIGQNMQPDRVRAALGAALVTEQELAAGDEALAALPDPFAAWPDDDADDPEQWLP